MSGEARFLCVFSNNSKVVVKRRRMNPSSSGRQKNVRHFAQRQYNPTFSTFFVSVQPYFTYLLFLCQLNPIMRRHTQFFVFFFSIEKNTREREKKIREREEEEALTNRVCWCSFVPIVFDAQRARREQRLWTTTTTTFFVLEHDERRKRRPNDEGTSFFRWWSKKRYYRRRPLLHGENNNSRRRRRAKRRTTTTRAKVVRRSIDRGRG